MTGSWRPGELISGESPGVVSLAMALNNSHLVVLRHLLVLARQHTTTPHYWHSSYHCRAASSASLAERTGSEEDRQYSGSVRRPAGLPADLSALNTLRCNVLLHGIEAQSIRQLGGLKDLTRLRELGVKKVQFHFHG
jgi:hypothetical protein